MKGAHSLNFGGNYLISNASSEGQQMVPSINLGFDTALRPGGRHVQLHEHPGRVVGAT